MSRTPSLIWAELELSSGEGGGFGRETLISSQVELIDGIFYPEVLSPLICKNTLGPPYSKPRSWGDLNTLMNPG